MAMRVIGIMAIVGAAAVLAGCSGSAEGGTGPVEAPPTVRNTPAATMQLFDPCTVSDRILAAAGADPATKDTNPFGASKIGFITCRWSTDAAGSNPGHFLQIASTSHTLDDIRRNDNYRDFRTIAFDNRTALQFSVGTSTPSIECGVAFDSGQGTVAVTAGRFSDSKVTNDLCTIAAAAASTLSEAIPRP
ncbi:DUF3558 domain-containing protein [Nocardia thailandica]|uniref:DUF3558 domain-containing protein n=1 Tax=Nocardia thailandica TaxID=257275 RepID=UPI00031EC6DB|nr:DUF3558 domain-containing protein [Nocardia thailandica]